MKKEPEQWVSTREFSKVARVQPNTVHVHHARYGSYYGIKPEKQPNGRLFWPVHEWKEMIKKLSGKDSVDDLRQF